MEKQRVEKLLQALKPKYPTTWPDAVSLSEWCDQLDPFSPLQVKYALDQLRHKHPRFPPNAMEFANLCDLFATHQDLSSVECIAPGCPIKVSSVMCCFHFDGMNHREAVHVSESIKRNTSLVRYYLFLQDVRLIEIPAPELWNWPKFALDGIARYPMNNGESPGGYLSRMALVATEACGVDQKYLKAPERKQQQKKYKQSANSFSSVGDMATGFTR